MKKILTAAVIMSLITSCGGSDYTINEKQNIQIKAKTILNMDSLDSLYQKKVLKLKEFDEVSLVETYDFQSDTGKVDFYEVFIDYTKKRDSLTSDIMHMHNLMFSKSDSIL